MFFSLLLLASLSVGQDIHPNIHTHHNIGETDAQYVSVTLDWWPYNTGSGYWPYGSNIQTLDFSNPKLKYLTGHLYPANIRVGGSLDNYVRYQVGNMTAKECSTPQPFRHEKIAVCMNMTRFATFLDFVRDSNNRVIWGLSYPGKRGPWKSYNVHEFLKYCASHFEHSPFYGVELGEEMEPEKTELQYLIDGYKELKGMVDSLWPTDPPLVMGPCPGMSVFNHFDWMKNFIVATQNVTNVIVYHSYNQNIEKPLIPTFAKNTLTQAQTMAAAISSTPAKPRPELYLGEGGPHNGGGRTANLSASFTTSLWYADELGVLATLNHKVFSRQSLVGSWYELLDWVQTRTFNPKPDYFTALLFKRIMGNKVLKVDLGNNMVEEYFHMYAHCPRKAVHTLDVNPPSMVSKNSTADMDGLSLLMVNINDTKVVHVDISSVPHATTCTKSVWEGSAKGHMLDGEMFLNGVRLEMQNDKLPSLIPKSLDSSVIKLHVQPYTYQFVFITCATNEACRS